MGGRPPIIHGISKKRSIMRRDRLKQIHTAIEEGYKREEIDDLLYTWEEIELMIKKMEEEEESKEEREKRNREPTFVEVVTEILYYHDPMHFAEFHFPEDEYDIEAAPIVSNLYRVDDIRSLKWMIYEVFVWKFSETSVPPSSDRRYKYIAEEIWEEWQYRIARAEAENGLINGCSVHTQ
jgi:hypothetical protein